MTALAAAVASAYALLSPSSNSPGMQHMDQIRWGMVSAGTIAGQFARDIALVDNGHVAAVAARDQQAASRFAQDHGIERAYQGYQALFDDPDIDAVYISTPHTLHLQNAIDALGSGKAVLCEKPVTTSVAELDVLLSAARDADGYLMEAMWTWFLPAVQTARAWFRDGRIGELRHIRADFGYPKTYDPESRLYDPALAGGCLLDMGIYPIAIARLFVEQDAATVDTIARFAPNGVDDDVVMQFNYDQCVASLATSFRVKLPNTAYIIGTEGYIEIPHFWSARECHLYHMENRVDSFVDERQGGGFEFQIRSVGADLLAGLKESATVTHAASRAFQRDMERVSARFAPQ